MSEPIQANSRAAMVAQYAGGLFQAWAQGSGGLSGDEAAALAGQALEAAEGFATVVDVYFETGRIVTSLEAARLARGVRLA